MPVRWMRVVLGALLLEIVLFVTLVPLTFVSTTLFLTAVPIGLFVFGYLVTKWVLRKCPPAHSCMARSSASSPPRCTSGS